MVFNSENVQILQGARCKNDKEQALKSWCVQFYLDGKRTRVTNNLNRIKDFSTKLMEFTKLQDEIIEKLNNGTYGKPLVKEAPTLIPSIKDASIAFMQWHLQKGSRPKTVQSYNSKLKYLVDAMGEQSVNYAYHKEISDVLLDLFNTHKWSPKTYNNTKLIYSAFFMFCIDNRWIENNPVSRVKIKYVGKSERNKAFTKEDFQKIMKAMEGDKLLTTFVKSIYFTCIRPKELIGLQVKHIDFNKRRIFIPASISKNKKDGYSHMDDVYFDLMYDIYGDAPQDAYLFCNDDTLWGDKVIHFNRPYARFIVILDKLGLKGKGYTLYSVKHYSNVQKFLGNGDGTGGWSLSEISKANRHGSISITEVYLKDLLDYIDVTKKTVPAI
ncbi:tyrosine-type recombinase/integrase [Sphingobacterium chungjuense]|uniref:tyrosine-type recombinase/integrase n=1 Tax=Sphingobacterium chungjuense TaxID=2675553 RepID=UPI00140A60BD|nr:site-specific integrase [Sphingobacterium chungjuense]